MVTLHQRVEEALHDLDAHKGCSRFRPCLKAIIVAAQGDYVEHRANGTGGIILALVLKGNDHFRRLLIDIHGAPCARLDAFELGLLVLDGTGLIYFPTRLVSRGQLGSHELVLPLP